MELKQPRGSAIKQFLFEAPSSPGIYKMISEKDEILYIGKAKNLAKRLSNYLSKNLSNRILRMTLLVHSVEIIQTKTEAEALLLEANMIKKFMPRFNILLKDDKSFPFIKISLEDEYPLITKFRGTKDKINKFYGPFASIRDVDETIKQLIKIFKLRTCSNSYFAARKRPCLQHQIGRCSAPCVGKISPDEYKKNVTELEDVLSGRNRFLQEALYEQMMNYSKAMEFEKAAKIRDKIKSVSYVQSKLSVQNIDVSDADIIAVYEKKGEFCVQIFFFRAGQNYGNKSYFPINTEESTKKEVLTSFIGLFYQTHKPPNEILLNHEIDDPKNIRMALNLLHKGKTKLHKPKLGPKLELVRLAEEQAISALKKRLANNINSYHMMEALKEMFNLERAPKRIEIYDNSHISGSHALGAMVVATDKGFNKNEYRLYNITSIKDKGDDYGMLREVMNRRFKRIIEGTSDIPDLMIIDGGVGHMNVTQKVMTKFNLKIRFVAMSKGPDRHAGNEKFHMPGGEHFTMDKLDPRMKYLQILRDEAHNFAIRSHRKKRSRALVTSSLEDISGIGKTRKMALLKYFGSVDAIKGASIEELAKVESINKHIARKIYDALHE